MQHWPIAPLLIDDSGAPITTRAAWDRKAAHIRSLFIQTLGPRPSSQHYYGHTSLGSREVAGITIQTIRLQLDVNEFMDVYLLQPADRNLLNGRAALATHQTSDFGKEEVAGLIGDPSQAYGRELALRGWTVVAVDIFALPHLSLSGGKAYDTDALYKRFPDWSAVGKMVSDLQITLDLMERLPATRGLPVSTIGHSLGGHGTMFLAVCDPRPVQTVNNAGFMPFSDGIERHNFFRDDAYIHFKHQGLKRSVLHGPRPLWDLHELIASIAPRRVLILASGNDDNLRSHNGIAVMTSQIHQLYEFLGHKSAFAAILHADDHTFLPWHRAAAYAWMEQLS